MNVGVVLRSPFVRALLVRAAELLLDKARKSLAKKEDKIRRKLVP